jgi:N-acyl-D-amino-acid deacylase
MDVMPSTTSFTHCFAYLPPWALIGSKEEIGERIADPEQRKMMLDDIENGRMVWPHTGRNSWSLNLFKLLGWDGTRIMSVVTEGNRKYEGKTVVEVARDRGKHPFDALCDLLIEEEGRVLVFSSLGEPEDNFTEQSIFTAVSHPSVCISTDTILMGIGMPSHLFYGAYPKFFSRYVREKNMLSLETAVRKCTGLPAEHFGLKQRGLIQDGYFADVLVFDPDTIAPNCNFLSPKGKPSGVEHVFINGRHVIEGEKLDLDILPGKLLRRA